MTGDDDSGETTLAGKCVCGLPGAVCCAVSEEVEVAGSHSIIESFGVRQAIFSSPEKSKTDFARRTRLSRRPLAAVGPWLLFRVTETEDFCASSPVSPHCHDQGSFVSLQVISSDSTSRPLSEANPAMRSKWQVGWMMGTKRRRRSAASE